MKPVRYYDGSGQVHTVRSEYNFGQYNIYLDGVFYASADDRLELDDAIRSLVAYKGFTVKRPKQKKTSPIRLTPDGNA